MLTYTVIFFCNDSSGRIYLWLPIKIGFCVCPLACANMCIPGKCINIYTRGSRDAETNPRSSEKHRRDVSDRDTRFRGNFAVGRALHRARNTDDSHGPAMGLLFFFLRLYGERCENIIRMTRQRGSTIMTRLSVPSRLHPLPASRNAFV